MVAFSHYIKNVLWQMLMVSSLFVETFQMSFSFMSVYLLFLGLDWPGWSSSVCFTCLQDVDVAATNIRWFASSSFHCFQFCWRFTRNMVRLTFRGHHYEQFSCYADACVLVSPRQNNTHENIKNLLIAFKHIKKVVCNCNEKNSVLLNSCVDETFSPVSLKCLSMYAMVHDWNALPLTFIGWFLWILRSFITMPQRSVITRKSYNF